VGGGRVSGRFVGGVSERVVLCEILLVFVIALLFAVRWSVIDCYGGTWGCWKARRGPGDSLRLCRSRSVGE